VGSIRPGNKVSARQMQCCAAVSSSARHWPCLFPQHGPGQKHLRSIELQTWQQDIVLRYPGELAVDCFIPTAIAGFTAQAHLEDGVRWYGYPRYMCTDESRDILRLRGETLDRLGVRRRFSRRNVISVARREVARLDEFVGPKH
jgi:hypothetical protein